MKVKIIAGLFKGEEGKIVDSVSSQPNGTPLSETIYFIDLAGGNVPFYRNEFEIIPE